MQELKTGDVVQLASGGPKMTVNGLVEGKSEWICLWFSGDVLMRGNFYPDALVKVNSASGVSTVSPPGTPPP